LLGDFNAKVGREDIIKLTIGNESLHEISDYNGFRVVNFATSKNVLMFLEIIWLQALSRTTWDCANDRTEL
jgi:hypothetical protein